MLQQSDWNELYQAGKTPWRTKPVDLPHWISQAGVTKGDALELGCGTGERLAQLLSLGFTAEGVDWSESALKEARLIAPGAAVRLWDLNELGAYPFLRSAYDLVIDIKTIAFVKDRSSYLDSIASRTRGVYIIETYFRHDEDASVAVREAEIMPQILSRFRLIRRIDYPFPHKDVVTLLLEPR